ncbi:hypothetical protein NLJ89_g9936 [Agrocybe chaxingu]|uniref:Uncharacterized protein n=1 Tax=Agrocybe chaxingu TaxID=84603 RepID=A0A9W8JS99_9AGAR|nr:hypothetical protein NLJ89_g9936 [Agrocybe chaxingu]
MAPHPISKPLADMEFPAQRNFSDTRSLGAWSKRHKKGLRRRAQGFMETADRISVPFTLAELEDEVNRGLVVKSELQAICDSLADQEPQACSALFVGRDGKPIFAYLSNRLITDAERLELSWDSQFEGRTLADLEIREAAETKKRADELEEGEVGRDRPTRVFDGISREQQWNSYVASQALCSAMPGTLKDDPSRHGLIKSMHYKSAVPSKVGTASSVQENEEEEYDSPESEDPADDEAALRAEEFGEVLRVHDMLVDLEEEDEKEETAWQELEDEVVNPSAHRREEFDSEESAGVVHLVHGWVQRGNPKKGLFISGDISKTSSTLAAVQPYYHATSPVASHISAYLEAVFPDWHKIYTEAFEAGCMFEEDPGPFYGRAIIYKLQGELHKDNRDGGPSCSFGVGSYSGGAMYVPQLRAKFRYCPGSMCLFFSSLLHHEVEEFSPGIQTPEMMELGLTPGRIGTVFFFPKLSLHHLKGKPKGWGKRTGFGNWSNLSTVNRHTSHSLVSKEELEDLEMECLDGPSPPL